MDFHGMSWIIFVRNEKLSQRVQIDSFMWHHKNGILIYYWVARFAEFYGKNNKIDDIEDETLSDISVWCHSFDWFCFEFDFIKCCQFMSLNSFSELQWRGIRGWWMSGWWNSSCKKHIAGDKVLIKLKFPLDPFLIFMAIVFVFWGKGDLV